MEILTSTGIVLACRNYGEADVQCTVLTRDRGKRNFTFKGLRKSRKRSRAVTAPGTTTSLVYYFREGSASHIVNDFSVTRFDSAITADLERIYHLYFILEAVDRTTGFDNPEPAIYDLLAAGIDRLAAVPVLATFTSFFLLHLLRMHGILPDLTSCSDCGASDPVAYILNPGDLRPRCRNCLIKSAHADGDRGGTGRLPAGRQLFTRHTSAYIRRCLTTRFSALDPNEGEGPETNDLIYQLALFIEHYFKTELKSKTFIGSSIHRSAAPPGPGEP